MARVGRGRWPATGGGFLPKPPREGSAGVGSWSKKDGAFGLVQELSWGQRKKIIEGIGRGLMYLHEDSRLKVIHRDLKAGNILLDADMNPKISDFGLAKLFDIDLSVANTSHIAGT